MTKHFAKTPIDFEPRRFEHEWDPDEPRYWHGGSPSLTQFTQALSLVFPAGERFFMDTVRHFVDQLDDPVLLQQVRDFLGQEAHHSTAHRRYNEHFLARGYDATEILTRVDAELAWVLDNLGPKDALAVTCALEHFTAIMADAVLRDPRYQAAMPEDHQRLWEWHAIEETEHKSVAFDVYRSVGGSELRRILLMLPVTARFFFGITRIQRSLLAQDGEDVTPKDRLRMLRWSLTRPGFFPAIAKGWLEWFRPGFHPWDHDNSEFVVEWKSRRAADGAESNRISPSLAATPSA